MEFILLEENLLFAIALMVMVGIAVLEGVGTLIGLGFGSAIDALIPDVDVDIDADLEPGVSSPFTQFLGWLHVGQVPVLILFIIFLTSFGIIGLIVQRTLLVATGSVWSGSILAIPVFIASLPFVSLFGGLLGKFMPREETEAVSEDSFIGLTAVVTLGTAKKGNPAEAKLTDEYGQTHYILVEPGSDGSELGQGESGKITGRLAGVYIV